MLSQNREWINQNAAAARDAMMARLFPKEGPGTDLKELVHSIGFDPREGDANRCNCDKIMYKMNRWGVKGCKRWFGELVEHLRGEEKKLNWMQRLKAAGNALLIGLVFRIDPRDPAPGLITEAIRRAEKRDKDKKPK